MKIKRGTNISHWLSQSDERGEKRRAHFTKQDADLLAASGLDHLRLPMDEVHHNVRDNLDSLRSMDSDTALRAKTHLGATAGLDFAHYAARVNEAKKHVGGLRRRITKTSVKLLPQ